MVERILEKPSKREASTLAFITRKEEEAPPKHEEKDGKDEYCLVVNQTNMQKILPLLQSYAKEHFNGKNLEECSSVEKMKAIVGVVNVLGGTLGIEYNSSVRMPFTLDMVIENKKGDCYELSCLILAAARRLELKNVYMVDMLAEVAGKEETQQHVCILRVGGEIYLLDATHNVCKQVKVKEELMEPLKGLAPEEQFEQLARNESFQNELKSLLNKAKREYAETHGKKFVPVEEIIVIRSLTKDNHYRSIFCMNECIYYRDIGEFDKAIEKADKALALDERNFMVHHHLGHIYYKKGKFDKAVKEYRLGIEYYANPNIYQSLAMTQRKLKYYPEAIESYSKAIKLAPKRVDILGEFARFYNELACVNKNTDMFNNAIKLGIKILNLQPRPNSREFLGDLYWNKTILLIETKREASKIQKSWGSAKRYYVKARDEYQKQGLKEAVDRVNKRLKALERVRRQLY